MDIANKKTAASFTAFGVTALLFFAVVHIFGLFTVNKWVGVGVGGGMLIIMGILNIALNKRANVKYLLFATIPVNAIACGLATSSVFIHLGGFPVLWHTAVLFFGMLALFALFCFLARIEFVRNHWIIATVIYSAVYIGGMVTGLVLSGEEMFILALFAAVPYIGYLVSLFLKANNFGAHLKNLAYCSFAVLFVVIFAALVILSDGEVLDGFDAGAGGGGKKKGIKTGKKLDIDDNIPPTQIKK